MTSTKQYQSIRGLKCFSKVKIWFLHKLLHHHLAPLVMEKIRQAELQRVKEEVAKQTERPLLATDIKEGNDKNNDQVMIPVRFRRMVRGRKPELHLRITKEIADKVDETHFANAMSGKTINVVFLIPKGLRKTKGVE